MEGLIKIRKPRIVTICSLERLLSQKLGKPVRVVEFWSYNHKTVWVRYYIDE